MNTKCRQAIEKYNMLNKGDNVVVGLSGGADSCALLHWLCSIRDEYDLTLNAVHVNHMIRGEEAVRDADHARSLCESLNVAFKLYETDIPKIASERCKGLEECGREERYRIFAQEAEEKNSKIATAHTLSDSVETILFHIIRGCTINGLRGIPPVRGKVIRPLILCERSDIEEYCAANNIEYVTDSSNLTSDYSRNKIRLQILPLMRQINPSVSLAIARLSECAAEDDICLASMSDRAVKESDFGCEAEKLYNMEAPILRRSLVSLCEQKLGITPEYRHVCMMQKCIKEGGGTVNLINGKRINFTDKNIYFLENNVVNKLSKGFQNWKSDLICGKIDLPDGHFLTVEIIDKKKYEEIGNFSKNIFKNALDYDIISDKPIFRFRRDGDVFSQAGRGNTKSLKKLLNENKIPVEKRYTLPLLSCGNSIVWIYSIGVAEGFQVTASSRRIVYIQYE